MKRLVFWILTLLPALILVATAVYLAALTNLPQVLYANSIRNIFFDCVQFVPEDYIYKMKPGPCRVKNIEYDIVLSHDADGFRNGNLPPSVDVAVLGDSFAHGIGVQDDETFAHLLSSRYHYRVRNLAIGSYATMRELDVLTRYGREAKYVVLQYCSNDLMENDFSLRLDRRAFRSSVETWWRTFITTYDQGKARGYRKPLGDLALMLRDGAYTSKAEWRKQSAQRDMVLEASLVAGIMARYQELLTGKRLIILEESAWMSNSAAFEGAFGAALSRLPWLTYRIIDTSRILTTDDYFFLDDHTNARGHRKLAAAIADEIARWERATPVLRGS
jgi:lysophospholipase L1-like esterase